MWNVEEKINEVQNRTITYEKCFKKDNVSDR